MVDLWADAMIRAGAFISLVAFTVADHGARTMPDHLASMQRRAMVAALLGGHHGGTLTPCHAV